MKKISIVRLCLVLGILSHTVFPALSAEALDVKVKKYLRDKGSIATAIAMNEPIEVVQALIRAGADLNAISYTGHTPLTIAVNKGNVAVIQLLVTSGADINQADRSSRTPLTTAIVLRRINIIPILLELGVDINWLDNTGETPLQMAVREKRKDIQKLLLQGLIGQAMADCSI